MASVIPIRKPLMNPDLDPNLFLRNVLIIKGFILENLVKSSPILKIPKPKTIYIRSHIRNYPIYCPLLSKRLLPFHGKDKDFKSNQVIKFSLDNVDSRLVQSRLQSK